MSVVRCYKILIPEPNKCLLFSGSLYPETNEKVCPQKIDPFIAGLLSVPMMGLGHFYTQDYFAGSMFILTDFVQKGLLILLILDLNDRYTDENGDKIPISIGNDYKA